MKHIWKIIFKPNSYRAYYEQQLIDDSCLLELDDDVITIELIEKIKQNVKSSYVKLDDEIEINSIVYIGKIKK